MPCKPIEVIYTDKQGTQHIVYTSHYSPTISHAINKYKQHIEPESTYKDECLYVGERILLSNLSGRLKEKK